MTTYYKCTRADGTDFRTGTIDYAAALASGEVITHPARRLRPGDASTYLSVSVAAADCTGFQWPCRLFRVEPVGKAVPDPDIPSKRCVKALRVVEELPAWQALGPNGEAVVSLIDRARTLTRDETYRMAAGRAAAWGAARVAAWDAARAAAWAAALVAAWDAARDAAWDAAWVAARDAAWALVARDLIRQSGFTQSHYDTLTRPWATVIGPVHPDDKPVKP